MTQPTTAFDTPHTYPAIKDILKKLVAFPSVTENTVANHQAIGYIDNYLRERGMHVTLHEFNGVRSLIATTRPTKTPEIFLVAHVDVVAANTSQFALREETGKLFGRGVLDMKFSIAAYLYLVDQLKGKLHEYDFGIMIVSDEETGGHNGVKKLIKEGYLPRVCVIPDGGANWGIEVFAKGVSWYTLRTTGRSAHASRPWEGESALEKMTALLADIQQLFPNQGPETNTLNIGQLHSGESTNQIPQSAEARLDARFANRDDQEQITKAIAKLCQRYGAAFEVPIQDPVCVNDPKNPYIARFMRDMEHVIGYPASPTIAEAASDARFFSGLGIPCIITYPPGGGHHGQHEWISEDGLYQFYDILHRYVTSQEDTFKK